MGILKKAVLLLSLTVIMFALSAAMVLMSYAVKPDDVTEEQWIEADEAADKTRDTRNEEQKQNVGLEYEDSLEDTYKEKTIKQIQNHRKEYDIKQHDSEDERNISNIQGEKYIINAGELQDIVGNLTVPEKLRIMSVLGKVGNETGEAIFSIARDGVTYNEIKKLEELVGGVLSVEEINELELIINR